MHIDTFTSNFTFPNNKDDITLFISKTKPWWKKVFSAFKRLMLAPFRPLQLLVGRVLSYLLLNPLIRENERAETLYTQNSKNPDPLYETDDEIAVLNVIRPRNFFIRLLFNWFKYIKYRLAKFTSLKSIFDRVTTAYEKPQKEILDEIEQSISRLISATPKPFTLSQIHIKGLEKLSPEDRTNFLTRLHNKFNYDFTQNANSCRFFTLRTPYGATLESVEIRPPDFTSENIKTRKFIVSCMPRSNNYQKWLKQFRILSNETGATIIGFNYRGTGNSEGIVYNQKCMRQDALAEVGYLLSLGVKPENIALMGECVGANIATEVAGSLQENDIKVKLFSSRSFRSTSSLLEGRIHPTKQDKPYNPLTWLKWLGVALCKFILEPFLYLADWDLNIDKAFSAINVKDRDFLNVRSSKGPAKDKARFRDDAMVPHKIASIYSLVKEKNQEPNVQAHKFHISSELHKNAAEADGHVCPTHILTETFPQKSIATDGREYTVAFFNRVWNNNNSKTNSNQTAHLA
ncbi:MAG: hypothetical protein A3F18_06765 [Legionellales bacterium RIFCSPHIGHO2_12_FULL_37_14]|nr:MAG: hypothetical protein A3F18_06765 [Legionellales bacterium RIFCSPHIGHO2_12_FULL_37_14]